MTTQTVRETEQVLAAGVTLEPSAPGDAALLEATLNDSTEIEFFRVKNSWGANRQDRAMVQGFEKGYHDLYLDYLNGPITDTRYCKEDLDQPGCSRERMPLDFFVVPPGY